MINMRAVSTLLIVVIAILGMTAPQRAFSQSQTGTIRGKVTDADGNPVANATVQLKQAGSIAVTDNNGGFVLQHLPPLMDTLLVRGVDLKLFSKKIVLGDKQTLDVGTLALSFSIKQLQDVEIYGRITHSYKSDYSFFGNKTETPLINIPQSISTVTKELIQDKMEFTVKDAVDEVAGVSDYSGYDEYTIRGFKAENARDINGLRGYNTTYESSLLVNVERVEVIKGPTATLYGNCDPGGTINLVTKKPLDKNEAELDLYGGTWQHFRAEGDITGPLNKSKTLLYRFNAGYDNTNSFRTGIPSKSYELAPSLTFVPNSSFKVNVDVSVSHISTVLDRGQPGLDSSSNLKATPISLTLSQPGDHLQETDYASIVSLSYKINEHLSFSTGYLNFITQQAVADHGLNDYITADSVDLYYSTWNYHTVTNTITNYFTYQFNSGKAAHQLLLGYDHVQSKVDLDQQYYELPDQFGEGSGIVGTFSLSNPQYFQTPVSTYQLSDYDDDATDVDADVYKTQGVYVQDQVSVGKWKLLCSLREEYYNGGAVDSGGAINEDIFLPRVGVVYSITPAMSVYGTFNKGFDPFEVSSDAQVFNSPFKPVISQLIEAGLKENFFRDKLSASVALYQLTLQNVAVNANDISNPNLFVQQGKDRSLGVETEANGNILPNLSVALSYAYCKATVIQSQVPADIGKLVENAPLNTSNSWIKYTINKGFARGFGLAAGHSQVSKRNTLVDGITLPGYCIFNAGLRYTYRRFMLAVNCNNISNKIYWAGAYNNVNKWPGVPRNAMVNLSYKF